MKRTIRALLLVVMSLGFLAGCRTSERWQEQVDKWPDDRPMGGTAVEFRQYHEASDNFREMMAAENETAER